MRIARQYFVRGDVQGVGFRYFAQRAADREGIVGWVRNLPDGRVEIEAEASLDALARFEREVRSGPRAGRVDAVEVIEIPASAARIGFNVR